MVLSFMSVTQLYQVPLFHHLAETDLSILLIIHAPNAVKFLIENLLGMKKSQVDHRELLQMYLFIQVWKTSKNCKCFPSYNIDRDIQ